jgi:hypothetical protein
MRQSIRPLIASLSVGLILPVIHANGVVCQPIWVIFGLLIGLTCYFGVSFLMSRLAIALAPKSFIAKQLFSMGYFVAPLLTFFWFYGWSSQ